MKRLLMLLGLVMALLVPAVAQPPGREKGSRENMRREMMEFKVKYLCQEMELSGQDEARFTELYTRMSQEREKLFLESRRIEKQLKGNKDASEAEYEAATKAFQQLREKDAQIEKRYDAEFAKFLTAKQIYKMKEGEHEFRNRMHKMRKGSK